MDSTRTQAPQRFAIRRKMTLMTKEYVVTAARPDGSEGEIVAFAHQKRITLKERTTFYTDETRKQILCTFEARQVLDPETVYDVRDTAGQTIGSFHNDPDASLFRSTWTMRQPGTMDLTGRERNRLVAGVRRIWDWLPFTDFVPFLWPHHFDFTENKLLLMTVDKKLGLQSRYLLGIHAPDLDHRLAIAQAIALDALDEV
ncbi:hypothetical protein ACFXP3_16190 [Streptomyces sp. NPDC059096]|uniref:hypothetical protein n=1 Tax=Streptomyces sp. NPDC059096 TaxID=3346727 RepID=UPI0036C48FFE